MNKTKILKQAEKQSVKRNEIFSLGQNSDIEILPSDTIRSLISMPEAVDLMEKAFLSLHNKSCYVPLRSVVESPDHSLTILFKPAFDSELDLFSIKLLSQNEMNIKYGLPTINGIVLLLDKITGKIVSIMDGDSITSIRTGALSGLATKLLSRPNSRVMALFGCGTQGRTQIDAVLSVRDIQKVYLYDINECAASNLMMDFREKYDIPFEYTADPGKLRNVDIICTATGATSPLFEPKHLKPGTHINAIGSYKPAMQEIHPEIMQNSKVYVDQKEACFSESGDILTPVKMGLIKEDHIIGDMGELLAGTIPGRKSDNDITLFKSVGVAAQDLFVANAAYQLSKGNEI